MKGACIRQTELPGTSKLYSDFLYDFKRVAHLYPRPPLELASIEASAAEVDFPVSRRDALVAALAAINTSRRSQTLLDRLAQPGTVAIVTGQQVGVYGGPAYSVYKALTAVRLAESLSASGKPAVPVFWLATEDHDFAEVDHAWIAGASHEPVKVTAQGDWTAAQPVGGVRITEISHQVLRESMQSEPFGDTVVEAVESAYRPGVTFGEAFRQLMTVLLGERCPLFIDPLDPAVRAIASPIMADAGRRSRELTAAVMERSAQLKAEGYHAQVLLEGKDASLFFALEAGRRVSLRGQDPESVTPERLSPNALLRPVIQDYLLPTAAMVGGPAEIAYLAQSAPLYEKLLGRQSVAVPRQGFTLLDGRSTKLTARLGLRLPDLAKPEEDVKRMIAERLSPPGLAAAFDQTAAQTAASLDRLQRELAGFDPTLAGALEKSRHKIRYQIEKTRRKAEAELFRRDSRAAADAAYLIRHVYPHRHLQERFYTFLPFVAAHGLDLTEEIYSRVHLECPDHNVLSL